MVKKSCFLIFLSKKKYIREHALHPLLLSGKNKIKGFLNRKEKENAELKTPDSEKIISY